MVSEAVTGARLVMGTQGYMAPEVVWGGEATPASDSYSLGVMFVYLLGAVRAIFDPVRREKYQNQAKFRFAVGVALLVYDIAGTKLRITTQPFFPGPAQILETFLIGSKKCLRM